MMEPSLVLQLALRTRLVATAAVTALVPATAILDRNARPEVFPCILIGEGQTVPDEGLSRNRYRVFADLHVWQKEAGLAGVKLITGAIREALAAPFWTVSGLHVADLVVTSTRFMRDADGIHAHGVASVEAVMQTIG